MRISGGVRITGGRLTSGAISGLILNLDAGDPASYSGSGTNWYDLSGKNNNFELQGNAPWTDDGLSSYFNFTDGIAMGGAILPNAEYTKVVAFRVSGTFGNIISGGVTDTDHAFWGAFTQNLNSGHAGGWQTVESGSAVPLDEWVFGAVTFSTTTGWSLYLNDAVNTNADTNTFTVSPAIVEIGGYAGNANNLNGDVAQVKIYNRALSSGEIATLYSQFRSRFYPV